MLVRESKLYLAHRKLKITAESLDMANGIDIEHDRYMFMIICVCKLYSIKI